MSRIFYECLDKDIPAGGVRRLYRHVEILRQANIDAYILHHVPPFRMTWFDSSVPIIYSHDRFDFDPSDVLVIPEGHANVMRRTKYASYRRVVISLNWANIFAALPIGEDWRDYGITDVIAGGEYERQVIKSAMGIDSHVVLQGLDTNMFRSGLKTNAITFMPHKQKEYVHLISCIFRAAYPQFSQVPLIPIDGVSHSAVARILSESSVFLAQSFPEGVSRKALEAMSCGCLVVGFSGHGSLEFMRDGSNCYLAPDGDALRAAQLLAEAVGSFANGTAERIQTAARSTALSYSPENEARSVLNFWIEYLSKQRVAVNHSHFF